MGVPGRRKRSEAEQKYVKKQGLKTLAKFGERHRRTDTRS